jgi:DNA-binding NarL/FixJ family response regulator
MVPYSILIVDDNPFVRYQLRKILEAQPDFDVCGEAENGREAIQIAENIRPELIILDLTMPVMNGLDAAHAMRNLMPETKLILFSNHGDAFSDREARSAGFSAVIPKHRSLSELIVKTRQVLSHTVF